MTLKDATRLLYESMAMLPMASTEEDRAYAVSGIEKLGAIDGKFENIVLEPDEEGLADALRAAWAENGRVRCDFEDVGGAECTWYSIADDKRTLTLTDDGKGGIKLIAGSYYAFVSGIGGTLLDRYRTMLKVIAEKNSEAGN